MVAPAPTVFRVLTEFNFEIGAAVAQSEKLEGAVQNISNAADDLLINFQKTSIGIVGQFLSGPGGGILGVLGASILQADKLTQSQIAFANVAGRGAGSFAERMEFARQELEKIDRIARGFALPTKDLVQITKILTPVLKQEFSPQEAFGRATDLGRFFLKAAPTLGIEPSLAVGQLQRAALGQASGGDPLFNILTQDTKVLNEFIGSARRFNQLPFAERIEKLTQAFKEFGNDAGVLEAVTMSLSGQMRLLRENLSGMFSVVAPLARIFERLATDTLIRFNNFLDKVIRPSIQNIAFGLDPLLTTSEQFLINVIQLSKLSSDLNLAGVVLTLSTVLVGLNFILRVLGVQIPFVTAGLVRFSAAMGSLTTLIGAGFGASFIRIFGRLGAVLNGVAVIVSSIFAPLVLLLGVFQLLSRAVAIFRIQAAERIAGLMERISEVFATASRLFAVFLDGFNRLAEAIAVSPIFEIAFAGFTAMIEVINFLVTTITLAVGGFQGLAFAILEFINQIKSAVTGGGFRGEAIGEAFDAGVQDIFNRVFGRQGDDATVSGNVTNIGKVEIRNDIKEKIEPDRLAFTLVDQLNKVATNPTQASGRKLAAPGFAGNR